MRNSFSNNNIKLEEFDALIKLTSEMAKYLYPYIRQILQSRDDLIRKLAQKNYEPKKIKSKQVLNPIKPMKRNTVIKK